MNKKIKICELLEMINNLQRPMPKKINCCGYEYEWDSDFQDYLRTDHKQGLTFSFLENHDDNLYCFLNDEVEILDDEDMEIEDVKLIELSSNGILNDTYTDERHYLTANLKDKDIYVRKINQLIKNQQILVREINKLKKEGK